MEPEQKTGSELYHRMLAFDYGNQETSEIMHHMWYRNPWIVDAYTGSGSKPYWLQIRGWLQAHFGNEADGLRDKRGRWQRGTVTIHGWTWIGFATKEDMEMFSVRWGTERSPCPEREEQVMSVIPT